VDSDTGQGGAAQRVYLTAAAISEEEESGDTTTGGQVDAHGMNPPRVTQAQLGTMRANQEREQKGELQRHSDTVEPLREITTMVVYLGVGRRANDREPGTTPIEMAVEVNEDA